jgi:DNA-binding LacI/PurR family transcriptional regulator
MYRLGFAAMEMLVNLISGRGVERLKFFRTRLVVRESTGERS